MLRGLNPYQELIVPLDIDRKLEEYESRLGWFDNRQPIGDAWFSVQVKEWEYTYSHIPGDYPILAGFPGYPITPIFSQQAVDALGDLLEGNGELLPLLCDIGKYYAFNITREVEALDDEKSEFKPLSPDIPDILCISHYAFCSDRTADTNIFKLPKRYNAERPLITDHFIQRVKEANLKDFAFNQLWSDQPAPTIV